MKLISRFPGKAAGFYFLSLFLLIDLSFAEPGVKIIEPKNGTIVLPGEEIIVRIEAIDGFRIEKGWLGLPGVLGIGKFDSLPLVFPFEIPKESAGMIAIKVAAGDILDNWVEDEIVLKVEQIATLQSLLVEPDELSVYIDWNGNIKGNEYSRAINVEGVYSDGISRDINKDPATTYVSSNQSVASVDSKGEVRVNKVGEVKITVSNSGVSKEISILFKEPRGIRPSETISPITQININPSANQAGWHNSDITITLTAQDNEGGSGIREIVYSFPYLSAESNFVENNQAVIPFSIEGINLFRYGASDKEGNNVGQKSLEIHLDKTPPQVSLELKPINLSKKEKEKGKEEDEGNWYEFIYSAEDNLSGLKDLQAGLAIINISGFKQELEVGNEVEIEIDEKKKELKIEAPNPEVILEELKDSLFNFNNSQVLQLKIKQGELKLKIKQKPQGFEIQASSIIFKAVTSDIADNTTTKELKFIKEKKKNKD